MSPPAQQPKKGVPVERVLITLGVIGVLGLLFLGTRGLVSQVSFTKLPVAGEWQSKDKSWHLTFHPDKTLASSGGPSRSDSQQSGTYSVNYFGTLWVTLKNGKIYSAELSPANPNRFDLIESDSQVPTVFERVEPIKTPESAKSPLGQSGS